MKILVNKNEFRKIDLRQKGIEPGLFLMIMNGPKAIVDKVPLLFCLLNQTLTDGVK